MNTRDAQYDPFAREAQLRAESARWNTNTVNDAQAGDIPVIDLKAYLAGEPDALQTLSGQLRAACEQVGFFLLTGHDVDQALIEQTFAAVREFHAQPLPDKIAITMDRADWPHGGMGYLPMKNAKLPAREKVNFNEAFLIKSDHNIGLDENQWPHESLLPGFRAQVQTYADAMNKLGKQLLPIFARALEMPTNFFDEAFNQPLYRLRMTHYPSIDTAPGEEFGINPHVDTTFFTILAQDSAGLTIFSEQRSIWLRVPAHKDAFVVNTGELLRQWTNDRFISVKHYANNNTSDSSRYSIPFFYNANPDYVMHCIDSCHGPDNPPKYAPVSYAASQAIAQGE